MLTYPQHPSDTADRNLRHPENLSHRFIVRGALFLVRAVSLALFPHDSCPATDPPADRTPIQAELVKSIEAGHVQVGDPVYAKVNLAWSNSACKLREGAI